MTTPSPSRPSLVRSAARTAPAPARRALSSFAVGLLALAAVVSVPGCTYSGGQLLYILGFGSSRKAPARFELTREPVMILLDDPSQRVDWPPMYSHLFDELSQQLLRHEAAARIIPQETVERLRQSVPDFEKRGCREIGEMAKATQVLWLEVREFLATEDFVDASAAAYCSVAVRVIDAKQTSDRTRVRLFPESPAGHIATVKLDGAEVTMAKTRDGIAKKLAERLADKIAKLFYEHELGDFEREE